MLPASFAIPYLLTAPLPPVLTMHIVTAADAPCRPVAQACYATARVAARNQSNRSLVLDSVFVVFSKEHGFDPGFDSPLVIPAFAEVTLPYVFELNVEAPQHMKFRYHEMNERGRQHHGEFGMSKDQSFLLAAATAACMRCNGGREELCRCETDDAGRRCTSATQCEGACLFDRFEKLPDPVCTPTPRTRCREPLPRAFRVGHCSELKAPVGCFLILTNDDSESRPILLPVFNSQKCWNAAELITESSRRR